MIGNTGLKAFTVQKMNLGWRIYSHWKNICSEILHFSIFFLQMVNSILKLKGATEKFG